jgi:hypothetical protein
LPILYVHGVNTRSRDGFHEIVPYLRRIVAPALSDDPEGVLIDDVFWGDLAATFAWNGASRPRTRLIGMGAEGPNSFDRTSASLSFGSQDGNASDAQAAAPSVAGGLITGTSGPVVQTSYMQRLSQFSDDQLSDLIASAIGQSQAGNPLDAKIDANLRIEADALARDPQFRAALTLAPDGSAELDLLLQHLQARSHQSVGLVGMGAPAWLSGLNDRLGEALRRADGAPAWVVSRAVAELRRPINDLVTAFLGDVFTYLDKRGTVASPGPIPQRLFAKLTAAQGEKQRRGGEPIVVLTHSMGGQLVYDAVTSFLPQTAELRDIRVDFWAATASQVGLFEELKLFLNKDPQYHQNVPVPFPHPNLGTWWNVWDYNDFISYTVEGIVDGVDDQPFDSGMQLLNAHGGYLKCPSFYRKFAARLRAADGKTS